MSDPDESLQDASCASATGESEAAHRHRVRSRFTEVEIDLILDLISSVPVAVWAARGKAGGYGVQLWSPGAESMYGFTKHDILGADYIQAFVAESGQDQAVVDHRRTEETHQPYRDLARDQRRDDSTRLVLTHGAPLWHPILKEWLQGEITVDATDVPSPDLAAR